MTVEEAREALKFHSFIHDDINNPRMETGFIGMLRPYRGYLIEENYVEVIQAIRVLLPEITKGDYIEREVIEDVLSMCFFASYWGINKDGMLRRNNLLSSEDIEKLQLWVEGILKVVVFGSSDSIIDADEL